MVACSHGHWGGRGRGRWSSHGQESILESGDIEALLGDDSTTAFATLNMEHLAPWSAAAGDPRDYLPSDSAEPEPFPGPVLGDHQSELGAAGARLPAPPLPGTAAAQVAQAFGRRMSFQSAPGVAERQADPPSSVPRILPSTDLEEPDLAGNREAPLAPPPGTAAAAVARAFAKMSTVERAPLQPHAPPPQPGGGHAPIGTAVRSARAAPDEPPSRAAACGHAGYCALQREGSVPPTPGVAAAQVASAFARLRSRSNSPRDSDAAADDPKSDETSRSAQHHDRAACQAFHAGACSACDVSDTASQGASGAVDGPRRASIAGRPDCWEHQAVTMQEAPESSRAAIAAPRSERCENGQGCEGARGNAIGELDAAARVEAKAAGRQGKGKERAGSSAKTWTEVCFPLHPLSPTSLGLMASCGSLNTRNPATAWWLWRVIC